MNSKEAYEYVIADLEQDVGWEPEAVETTLSLLKQRLHLITDVHPTLFTSSENITDLFNEDIDKMFSWIPEVFEESTKNPDTSVAEEMNKRFSKFSQEEDEDDNK
jgi:hypothetical protein